MRLPCFANFSLPWIARFVVLLERFPLVIHPLLGFLGQGLILAEESSHNFLNTENDFECVCHTYRDLYKFRSSIG